MKTFLLFAALLFAEITGAFAANWHPFPFKVAYYGRHVEFGAFEGAGLLPSHGPLYSGSVIEGIYLDAFHDGGLTRRNSADYTYYSYPIAGVVPFMSGLGMSIVKTKADSSYVTWKRCPDNWCSGGDSMVIPRKKPVSTTFSVDTVLGITDSLASFSLGNQSVVLSKNFGLIRFSIYVNQQLLTYDLKGIGDIGTGWQPYQASEPVLPKVGDEMHYRYIDKYTYQPIMSTPFGPTCTTSVSTITQDYRIKVLEYPYMGDVNKALYQYIVSEEGAQTGVLYTSVLGVAPSSYFAKFYPPGTNSNNDHSFGYFVDDMGMNLYFDANVVIDGGEFTRFSPCVSTDALDNFAAYPSTIGCSITGLTSGYPVYAKFQNGCTMGTPWPPVTITETKNLVPQSVSFFPNPVKEHGYIQAAGMDGTVLNWQLTDMLGRTMYGNGLVENGRAEVDFSDKMPGIYMLSIPGSTVNFRQRVVCR